MDTLKRVLLILLILVALGYTVAAYPAESWTRMRIAGVSIGVPALVLWAIARFQLGKSFSIQPKAKELVTHGIYSKIRNPIYLFGMLLIVGFILYIQRPIFLLVLVVLIPMQWLRIKKEEKVLQEKFGEAYVDYKRKTWF
jgi:protein-S-isoprenylcysteine O-methyltransferase Ste14